jgi:hypothetical protein
VDEIRSEERKRLPQHRVRARDLPPSGTRPGPHGHRDEVYKTVAILCLRALERAPYAPYAENDETAEQGSGGCHGPAGAATEALPHTESQLWILSETS